MRYRLLAVFAFAILACPFLALLLKPADAQGPIKAGPPPTIAAFGVSSVSLTGSGVYNLSSGTATPVPVPCSNVVLSVTGSAVLLGSSSTSLTFTCPTGVVANTWPINDISQVWVQTSGGTTAVISAAYGH